MINNDPEISHALKPLLQGSQSQHLISASPSIEAIFNSDSRHCTRRKRSFSTMTFAFGSLGLVPMVETLRRIRRKVVRLKRNLLI